MSNGPAPLPKTGSNGLYLGYKPLNLLNINSKELRIKYNTTDNFTNITISKNIRIISPILIPIFGANYEINTEKSVINE